MFRKVTQFTSQVLLCVLVCSTPLLAQLPERFKHCLPYPTLADEISEMKASTSRPKPKAIKSIVDEVKFDGAIHLPQDALTQLVAEIKGREFEGSGWLNQLEEVGVRGAWQDQGYFTVHATAESRVLSRDSDAQHVSVTIHIQEGIQYRL